MPPNIKKLTDLTPAGLAGKRVWLRLDWNVAVKKGRVEEGYRIDRTLETINFLKNNGAKIVLATHISDATTSLTPIIEYAKTNIDLTGVEILPNLRTLAGEEENSVELAKQWASGTDIYVNEAFAASHRAHASIVGLPQLLPSYAGFNFVEEVETLSKCFTPVHPSLLVVGGAKLESKQPVIDKLKPLVDKILIGGKLVYEFLDTTDSQIIVSKELVREGDKILDIVITDDIKEVVKTSKRIIWAGPMGRYDAGYPEGTINLAKAVAESGAESIVGGGDTIAAIPPELLSKFSFVSTGGGAMLEFLATGTLPGVEALKR